MKKQIKHIGELLVRFLALLVVIFLGITAIMPQRTTREMDADLPSWKDVSYENSPYVSTVYKNGIMDERSEDAFGVTDTLTSGELAFISVALHELHNGIDRSYESFLEENSAMYIDTAISYGIWGEGMPNESRGVTRYELSEMVSRFVPEKADARVSFSQIGMFKNPEMVLNLYNLGIRCHNRASVSYSPYITATREDACTMVASMIDGDLRRAPTPKDYSGLKQAIEEKISGWQGDWSVYFEDYQSGDYVTVNSHQVYSASLIKLFIAESVYRGMANGTVADSKENNEAIRRMITYSDNDSWSYLARVLGGGVYSKGMARVTEEAQSEGFSDTGTFYKGPYRNYNFTSVNDCGVFLARVLDGTIVSESYSQKLLAHLENQAHRHKLPSGVPANVKTANKTGELDYIQGDAMIAYAPSGTYILAVIGDGLTNSYGCVNNFTELSKLVYDYLNPTTE